MLVTATLGVLALAAFTLAKVGRNMQIFAVGTLAFVLILVQRTIPELDCPAPRPADRVAQAA